MFAARYRRNSVRFLLPLALIACGQKEPSGGRKLPPVDGWAVGPWVRTQRGFAMRGYVGVTADSAIVLFGASIRNFDSDTVEVVLEGCATGARAFGSAERSGRPLWRAREPGCSMIGPIGRRLAPGDTLPMAMFAQRFPIDYVLGDSLPDGLYHFETSPPVTARDSQVTSQGVSLYSREFVPAGAVWLARRRSRAAAPPQ